MNERSFLFKESVEEIILATAEESSEKAYEKFNAGEINENELNAIYSLLHRWTADSEKVLRMIDGDYVCIELK